MDEALEKANTKPALRKQYSTPSRQLAWLRRSKDKAGKRSLWRGRTLHQLATKRWLQNIDNQFRLIGNSKGLFFFQMPTCEENMVVEWGDCRKMPFMALGLDFGSDGVCGIHGMQ